MRGYLVEVVLEDAEAAAGQNAPSDVEHVVGPGRLHGTNGGHVDRAHRGQPARSRILAGIHRRAAAVRVLHVLGDERGDPELR